MNLTPHVRSESDLSINIKKATNMGTQHLLKTFPVDPRANYSIC